MAEAAARGEPVDDLILSVTAEVAAALMLEDCQFRRGTASSLPTLDHDGSLGDRHHGYARGGVELPPEGVELSVLGRGTELGRLVLMPTPGVILSRERRMIAVALADQLGQVLAHEAAGG